MNIFTIDTIDELEKIKEPWGKLYFSNNRLTKFQSWEFNFIWWKTFNKLEKFKLKIICFGSKKNLKVILPCYIDEKNCLRFLQDGYVDFLDIIYSNNNSTLCSDIKKITDFIKNNLNIKSVVLNNLKLDSPVVNFFPYFFKNNNFFFYQSNQFCFLDREKFDEQKFYFNLTAKQRNDLKKIDERLVTECLILNVEKTPFPEREIEGLLKDLIKHNNREYKIFQKLILYLKSLYNENLIYFICHKINKEVVSLSALLDLKESEKLIWIDFYNVKVKKINLKNYITLIKFTKNKFHLNLGTGNHDYKIKNFSPELISLYTFYYNKNKLNFVYKMFRKIVARMFHYF